MRPWRARSSAAWRPGRSSFVPVARSSWWARDPPLRRAARQSGMHERGCVKSTCGWLVPSPHRPLANARSAA
jgi:hypothetical protein